MPCLGSTEKKVLRRYPPSRTSQHRNGSNQDGSGVTLSGWKALVRGLVTRDDGAESNPPLSLFRFWTWINEPRSQLSVYTTPLTSPSCTFIAHISICNHSVLQANELLALAHMTNLGVLEIVDPADASGSTPVTDRLLRGWSETPGAFPTLRVLRILANHPLSPPALRYVSRLPSLAVFEVTLRDFRLPRDSLYATDLGWRAGKGFRARDMVDIFQAMEHFPEGPVLGLDDDDEEDFRLESILADIYTNDEEQVRLQPRTIPEKQGWERLRETLAGDRPGASPRKGTESDFGAWAFWLYAAVGWMNSNRDLVKQMPSLKREGRLRDIEVSPLPVACVQFGEQPRRPAVLTPVFTFVRPSQRPPSSPPAGGACTGTEGVPDDETHIRPLASTPGRGGSTAAKRNPQRTGGIKKNRKRPKFDDLLVPRPS